MLWTEKRQATCFNAATVSETGSSDCKPVTARLWFVLNQSGIIMSEIIGFHYTLLDKDGKQIESSISSDPLLIMTGRNQILPKLEKKLLMMKVGDKADIVCSPKEGYGEVDDRLKTTVERAQFPPNFEIKEGVRFNAQKRQFLITKIAGDTIHVDGNHPMAGQELHFSVEITERRQPTESELDHGHAHGPGGHQH